MTFKTNCLAAGLLILASGMSASGGAGDLDLTFDPGPGVNTNIFAMALQSDGKIIVGGDFTRVRGLARTRIARLNSDGSGDSSFSPSTGANSNITSVAVQSDGKILIGGAFTNVNGTSRNRIARLNSDGSLDTGFNPGTGANSNITSIALQPDGKVLIGGAFTNVNGNARSRIARLNSDGSVDTGFNPGTGANDVINSVAVQSNGKVIIGGQFTLIQGTNLNRIARLNSDGSVDTSFVPGIGATNGANNAIFSVTLQTNGLALIGGQFTTFDGTNRNNLARLNTDGSLDLSFNPGTGPNGAVKAIAVQPNGLALIGGTFTSVNGTNRTNIARLNIDGSLDTVFNPGAGADNAVNALAVQTNSLVLIGGQFSYVGGTNFSKIARLNSNGNVDGTFNPGNGGLSGLVNSVVVQTNGLVLVGGAFTKINGLTNNFVARLKSDGSLDSSFNVGVGPNGSVQSVALQTDGKVLIGGAFTTVGGTNATNFNRIARLNTDGSLDNTFNPSAGANGDVYAVTLQTNGLILIGGAFTSVNGTTRNHVARLNSDGSLDNTFDPGTAINNTVFELAVQADGLILAGGQFTAFNSTTINDIGRFNSDGTVDGAFNPGTGANGTVISMSLQSDGTIYIGGTFTTINGTTRNRIARLNSDGSLDNTFSPSTGANNTVRAVVAQSDGKVLLGGSFSLVNSSNRNDIARMNTDGSLDTTFNPGTGGNGAVISLALQSDGRVLLGGQFTAINGVPIFDVARLLGDSGPKLTIAPSGANVILSWPSPSTGFGLQQNSDLTTTNWISVSQMPTDDGITKTVTLPFTPPPPNLFFRLIK